MFGWLLAEKRSAGAPISLKNIPGFHSLFGGGPTASGVEVTPQSSLSLPVVWACVDIIARTIASLPLPVYKTLEPQGKERVYNHPLWDILQKEPNSEQTAYTWRHLMSIHQNIWGVGISEIEFDSFTGQPKALWPIPPWRVTPDRTRTGALVYRVAMPTGNEKIFSSDQVVVFQSLTTSPDKIMSPISVHRESIGAAQAVKQFGARTFGQGVNPAGTLSGVKFGTEESQETLRAKYGGYEGLGASHRLMFLEEGMEYKAVGLPPEDAQYLETRRLDVSEMARIWHVPLYKLQETTGATSYGTGLEEFNREYMTSTILPNSVQWEQELNKKLVFQEGIFCEFLLEGMLRANFKDRVEGYWKLFQMGGINQDEMRALENKNPLPDGLGQTYMVPMNMVKIEDAGKFASKDNNNEGGANEEKE